MRLFTWIALRLGRRVARALLIPIVAYYVLAGRATRVESRNYLRRALGRQPRLADSFGHLHCFAAVTLDRLYFLNDRHALFDIDVHGSDVVRDAFHGAGGRPGACLVGAHIGSFEAVRAAGREETTLRVSMVMYEDNARRLHRLLTAINPRFEMAVIALGQVDSMLRVKEALDEGRLVGMLADRTLAEEAGGDAVREVMILGDPVLIPTGPFRMAAMLGRQMIFNVGLYRGGNRYEVHYEDLFDFRPRRDRAATREAIDRAIDRYAERLEHYCRIAPDNWFNFYDYWNDAATT
jgi:predicted LPLAT superfamily acyltransferase